MPKILAIESGGDWADASVAYVQVPDDFDRDAARADYHAWLRGCNDRLDEWRKMQRKVCFNAADRKAFAVSNPEPEVWMSFSEWLVMSGIASNDTDALLIVDNTGC